MKMSLGKTKRWYRSKRNQIIIVMIIIFSVLYYISMNTPYREPYLDVTRRIITLNKSNAGTAHSMGNKMGEVLQSPNVNKRGSVIEYIEKRLEMALKQDKGTGCDIPKLDPFAKEVAQFEKPVPKVVCYGKDWVKCYHSTCRVVPEILNSTKDIVCSYSDIVYINDFKRIVEPHFDIYGGDVYELDRSDHVKVVCSGKHIDSVLPSKWIGYTLGFRKSVHPKASKPAEPINVLIIGFDSTSKNGFIRRMPKSYKVLTEILGATVLNGYNIVGDGTPAALFPILTGQTELELPDVRRKTSNNGTLDASIFMFDKLKEYGYRTAYFEDMPAIGTFQYRFNGFNHQPADHYLRAFYLEESANGQKWHNKKTKYCVGDRPQYKLMLNITDQFLNLDAKKFCFTFIADITHDDFNMISTADDDFAEFLMDFQRQSREEDTLLFVMGDHGPRYANVRDTFQGKLEERLPLMAVRLPDAFVKSNPSAQESLLKNAEVLTTPHDIYATVADVLNLRHFWNNYKIKGADLTRGLTLLEPIPKNRSCSEAGIEPHWCSCLSWENVSTSDPLYQKSANAFVDFINSLTETVRTKCVPRTLTSVAWVMRQRANTGVLTFVGAKDADGYVGKFGRKVQPLTENYQVKLTVGPGRGVYEASMTYVVKEDRFQLDTRDISRTNAYNDEPHCISASLPSLNMYCYCND
ncbi:uncharacterized protein LOC112048274 [Bicyclus anynana]|uniref:Uncharacterized protein LOC112048274 n=1 Tax=Bicyclus anynana TaxID=110368 RepID=A0A6J1NEH6_BICAN|nr:uncharacterized protein LOC112048274 [Bicyclus anynana]